VGRPGSFEHTFSRAAHGTIQPTVVAFQVGKIYFDPPCKYCRDGRRATTNIRPVDSIGRLVADMNVCTLHAGQLVERARASGLEVSMWPPAVA